MRPFCGVVYAVRPLGVLQLREKSRLGSDTFNRNSEAAECQRGLEFVFGKLKSMHTEHAMTGDVISSAIIDRLKGIEEHYIVS